MNSLPTQEQINRDSLLKVIKGLDPELYMIKIALEETGVNPIFVPKIIRAIGNLTFGTGHGRVQIYMQAKVIKNITGEENILVNQDATREES